MVFPATNGPRPLFGTLRGITATPDGSQSTLVWPAPTLSMVILDSDGGETARVLEPEAGAPPVLTLPLCSG